VFIRFLLGASELRGSISISGGRLQSFRATFYFLAVVCALWIIAVGALLFGIRAFSEDSESARPRSVASGSVYMSVLAMAVILQVAIIFPGLLILQPMTLWRVTRKEKYAITPRQRFRGACCSVVAWTIRLILRCLKQLYTLAPINLPHLRQLVHV
jgi:calcium permeable stress-gated cation channel